MYGLIFEGLRNYVTKKWSEDLWSQICEASGSEITQFESRKVYDDELLQVLFEQTAKITEMPVEDVKFGMGLSFVEYVDNKGYHGILRVLGRELRDFLNGLDNLHEFLRVSYPKINPPSFFCVNENKSGITLQYRSHRSGMVSFFCGWMTELSRTVYNTEMQIEIIGTSNKGKQNETILRLHFDNVSYGTDDEELTIPPIVFFEAFPFNFVFNRGMKIINIGRSLANVLSNVVNRNVTEFFTLTRPLIPFAWDDIILHTNIIFELVNKVPEADGEKYVLKLRGQMKYMYEWDSIVFLGTPIMRDVNALWDLGLFLNDLSMHDSSRDMVLAGEQQAAELKLALEQENEKSRRLEESLRRLDEEMRRTDDILYQMIPRAVAERLRAGEAAVDTCETFEEVTLLLSDVVGFTTICSGLMPLEVVNLLNRLYSVFDGLTEKHKVYKVETIGDAYMIASGCPTRTNLHAPLIAEMSLDMVESVQLVKDESKNPPESLRIRVGIHTGPVVAGVVGVKMPRYCLFGSTVTTAEIMEATSKPQQIQVSRTAYTKLRPHEVYNLTEKGEVELKDGGTIKTYWLNGRPKIYECTKTEKLIDELQLQREKMSDSNITYAQSATAENWESVTASYTGSAKNLASRRTSMNSSRRGSVMDTSLMMDNSAINRIKLMGRVSISK